MGQVQMAAGSEVPLAAEPAARPVAAAAMLLPHRPTPFRPVGRVGTWATALAVVVLAGAGLVLVGGGRRWLVVGLRSSRARLAVLRRDLAGYTEEM
jgi:hypothetical protein